MKGSLFFFYFLLVGLSGRSQNNLIPNPGFEIIDSCYGTFSPLGFDVFQWAGCLGWKNPTYASSDLFCQNGIIGNLSPPSILPPVFYQNPRQGNNMAGIYMHDVLDSNYREYIQTYFTSPLIANTTYQVSFFVNTLGNWSLTSSIGAYISNGPVGNSTSYYCLPYSPQVRNPLANFISDTLGWTQVTGTYQAQGGENYMTIGSFDNSLNFTYSNSDSLGGDIYFFVDDVSVVEIPLTYSFPNVFSPNGDGVNDLWKPTIVGAKDVSICVYNRWGTKVYEFMGANDGWDGVTTSGEKCPDGTYFFVFSVDHDGEVIKEKGFIQLLR